MSDMEEFDPAEFDALITQGSPLELDVQLQPRRPALWTLRVERAVGYASTGALRGSSIRVADGPVAVAAP